VLRGRTIDPLAIAEAMQQGDAFARSVFEEAGELLGFACAGAAKLLDVLHLIVGGGIADAGDVLIDATVRSLRDNVFSGQREQVDVRRAQFGNQAGIIGAALLVA
jgi:glucokinase